MPGLVQGTFFQNYTMGSAGPLLLTVTIGNADPGGIIVTWGAQVLTAASGQPLMVGTAPSDLRGQVIYVTSTVFDANKNSNSTDVHYDFGGGPLPGSYDSAVTVPNDGDVAIHTLAIYLY